MVKGEYSLPLEIRQATEAKPSQGKGEASDWSFNPVMAFKSVENKGQNERLCQILAIDKVKNKYEKIGHK